LKVKCLLKVELPPRAQEASGSNSDAPTTCFNELWLCRLNRADLAPQGYYLLFIVNTSAVPSVAPFVPIQ